MTKNNAMQRILKFLLLAIFWSGFSFADQYKLLPENLIPNSDCVPSQYSCFGYGFDPVKDCKNGVLDSGSCSEISFYGLSKASMVSLGDTSTEGRYIKCNGGTADFENCTKKGAFENASSYSQATPNINKNAHYKNSGSDITDSSGNKYYCPTIGCDVRTQGIALFVGSMDGSVGYYTYLKAGQHYNLNVASKKAKALGATGVDYRVDQAGNNLCLFATTDIGQILVGCKQYPDISSVPPPANTDCFANTACAAKSKGHTKVFWSVSSKVVECVRDVLDLVFINDNGCQNKNFFPGLQNDLRKTVTVALILYVIIFGVQLVTGTDFFDKKQFFGFILKIALVLYFSVGLKGDDGRYHSGLSELIYPGGVAAMTSFSTFVMESTSDNGLCNYKPSDYDEGYGYLSVWDALDCRVAYYLGLYLIKDSSISDNNVVSGIFGIFGTIIPGILSLEFIYVFFIIIYGIFILSIAVYFVHFYVIALICFTVTVYLGVITVPMALFSYTKKYFDQWLKVLISYVLQPVVVTTFLAFLLLVFDSVIYGDCQFEEGRIFGGYNTWVIRDSTGCTDPSDPRCASCVDKAGLQCASVAKCEDSIGWAMLGDLNSSFLDEKNAIFFRFTILGRNMKDHIVSLLKVVLFIYLLSLFAADLGNFAARLTEGPNIGQFARDPAALFRDIMNAISKSAGKKKKGKGAGGGKKSGVKVGGKKRSGINVSKKPK